MADIHRKHNPPSPALSLYSDHRLRPLHILVASTGSRDTSYAQALVVRLSKTPGVELRAIVDDPTRPLQQICQTWHNRSLAIPAPDLLKETELTDPMGRPRGMKDLEMCRKQACNLVEWADLLVCVPLDVDAISKMLAGFADTMLLRILRGWDTKKDIILVPGMSRQCLTNHMTQRQTDAITNEWHWIRLITPIEWTYDKQSREPRRRVKWTAFDEVVHLIRNQLDLHSFSNDIDMSSVPFCPTQARKKDSLPYLPPEIWSMILTATGDWELAQSLNIYTALPIPEPWKSRKPQQKKNDVGYVFGCELEDIILRQSQRAVCRKLSQAPPEYKELTPLAIKLIIRFSMTGVLKFIESNFPALFKAFDNVNFTVMASAYYGRTDILDYWKESPYFKGRHHLFYTTEAVDGASKNGFTQVLDWWHKSSGLPFLFTEAALEQASARGDISVLNWWRDASLQDESIVPRPGKSLLLATQNNRLEVIRWWVNTDIAVAHGDSIPRMASRWGKVEVLELWRQLQGDDKIVYDQEVLTVPTTHQHIEVLDWWLKYAKGELPGMEGRTFLVPYRTCNVEEALEDSIGDRGNRLREWWAENGLNLGLRNFEWMNIKYLGLSS